MIKSLKQNCDFCSNFCIIREAEWLVNNKFLCSQCVEEFKEELIHEYANS